MPTETRSLHRKLAQIMYEAERIPKRGKAPAAMGGYPFVQVGDAADFIRKQLADKVLTMMPTKVTIVGQVDRPTKAGGSMTTVDLLTEWTITDGESGESIVIQSFGAGADGGDKYSGKASTSAMKYALLTGFLLSTGDDVELGVVEHASRAADPDPSRVDKETGEIRAAPPPKGETETLLGGLGRSRAGTIAKTKSRGSDLEARETPNGQLVGFRFDTPKGAIEEVWAEGEAAAFLFAASNLDLAKLDGQHAVVNGMLYRVTNPQRPARHRLRLTYIEVMGAVYPATVPVEFPEPKALPPEEAAEIEALPWPDTVERTPA